MIRLENVTKRFANAQSPAVDRVSFEIDPGSSLALVGLSGSGKTTTLKMINRLIEPTSGEIIVDGHPVKETNPVELRRHIGYVFQGVGLFPHWTVRQSIGAVPGLLGWKRDRIRARTEELLELVGLPAEEYADRLPAELSGGQRQRIGVARALAAEPRVLLMDEPFGALDATTRDQLQQELIRIRERTGVTIVLVTHDIAEAVLLADRVGVMKDGRLLQLDTPEALVRNPADAYVSALFESPMRLSRTMSALTENAP